MEDTYVLYVTLRNGSILVILVIRAQGWAEASKKATRLVADYNNGEVKSVQLQKCSGSLGSVLNPI